MHLCLVHFDRLIGPRIFMTIPPAPTQGENDIMTSLLDIDVSEDYFEFIQGDYAFLNMMIEIPSPVARGNVERMMISGMVDKQKKSIIAKEELEEMIKQIRDDRGIYQAFSTSEPKNEEKIEKLRSILEKGAEQLLKKEENYINGSILILGLGSVGKTTIIKRLNTGAFDGGTRPTLGTQIIKTVIENFKFKIYDVGGQKTMRKYWFKAVAEPDAIVYVFDVNNDEVIQQEDQVEFKKVLDHYYKKSSDVPLVVIGNKIDLLPDADPAKLMKKIVISHPFPDTVENRHIGAVSAKTAGGMLPCFKWLVRTTLL